MSLIDILPDADELHALGPDELGLRMLPALANWREHSATAFISLDGAIQAWVDGQHANDYPPAKRVWVKEALREAWFWLEGAALLIPAEHGYTRDDRLLSRRARQLAQEPDARKVFASRRISKESLHPNIREDVWQLYHRGKYDTAVFEAMKAVEVAVRDAVNHLPPALVGVKLMRAAFSPSPNPGPLTDTDADGGEQVARMEFFAGAIGAYKNPHSHRNVALDDADETAEIIMIANHLLRIVDSRRAVIDMDRQ